MEDGTSVEYTLLNHFKLKGGTTEFFYMTLLLDLGEAGKWVYGYKIHCTYPKIPDLKEESFTCLETKETVKILYTFVTREDKIEKYTLIAEPSGKTFVLPFGEAQQKPEDFIPFVKENFFKNFVAGLDKLRKITFFAYSNDWSFWLVPPVFRALWGVCKETDTIKTLSPEKVKFPKILHYNCDFDAKFGYPCSKDEVPAKNPKVLIVPQK